MNNYGMTQKQTTYVFVTLMNQKATSSKIIKNNNVFFPSHSVAYNRAFFCNKWSIWRHIWHFNWLFHCTWTAWGLYDTITKVVSEAIKHILRCKGRRGGAFNSLNIAIQNRDSASAITKAISIHTHEKRPWQPELKNNVIIIINSSQRRNWTTSENELTPPPRNPDSTIIYWWAANDVHRPGHWTQGRGEAGLWTALSTPDKYNLHSNWRLFCAFFFFSFL